MHNDERVQLLSSDSDGNSPENLKVPFEDALKRTGYGKFHYIVLALCGWAVSSDAIEVLSVSFMLPSASCSEDLNLSSTEKGWLTSIIFIGMMIGGYFWGSLADHFGRRQILLNSLTVNGLGALASSFCQVYWAFLLFRLISGIGVGGSIPVIFAYFTEFQPKERRGTMISILATFWMFGNIIAAALAWIIIPHDLGITTPILYNSWRIFVAVCTLPSLSSAVFFYFMPESPKFLLTVGREEEAISVLKQVHRANNPTDSQYLQVKTLSLGIDIVDDKYRKKNSRCQSFYNLLDSTKELFSSSLIRTTVIMLIITFTISFGYYGLWMWFPELFDRVEKYGGSPCSALNKPMNSTGNNSTQTPTACKHPDNWVFFSGFMTALSNLPGNIFTIFLMDRIGRKSIMVMGMLGSGVSVFFLPLIRNKVENLAISCIFGAISTLGWNALDVLQAELFPTNTRSTASGLCSGIGRIAAILGNVIFGELVDTHCAIPMLLAAGLLIFGGLCTLKLPNTTKIDIH